MDNSVNIMRTRIDKLGVSEPVITKQGSNQIDIELPAVHDPAQAAKIIGQTAELELYDLTPSLLRPIDRRSAERRSPIRASTTCSGGSSRAEGPASAYYLFNSRTKKLIAGDPTAGAAQARPPLADAAAAGRRAEGARRKATTGAVKPGTTTSRGHRLEVADRPHTDGACRLRHSTAWPGLPGPDLDPRRRASPTTTSSSTAPIRTTPRAPTRR